MVSVARVRGTCTTYRKCTNCDLYHALHWSRHTHHMSCTVVLPFFLETFCAVLCPTRSGALLCWSLQHECSRKTLHFRYPWMQCLSLFVTRERSLDQPGILVAHVEGVQEEGMAGGTLLGTSIGGMDPIVPVAVSAPFSSGSGTVPASAASSVFPPPPFSLQLASSCAERRKVEKSRVSRKKGKVSESASVVEAGGEEVVAGAGEEEATEKTGFFASGGAGGLVAECSVESGGLRVDAEPENVNPVVLESAKHLIFTEFLKIRRIAEVPRIRKFKTCSPVAAHPSCTLVKCPESSRLSAQQKPPRPTSLEVQPRILGSWQQGNRTANWWTEACCQEDTETCSSDLRRRRGQHRNGS